MTKHELEEKTRNCVTEYAILKERHTNFVDMQERYLAFVKKTKNEVLDEAFQSVMKCLNENQDDSVKLSLPVYFKIGKKVYLVHNDHIEEKTWEIL